MKLVAIVVVSVLLCAVASASEQLAMFEQFKQRFNRQYASEQEEALRFSVFKANLAEVDRLNALEDEVVYGVTKFMDMTPEEFRSRYLGAVINHRNDKEMIPGKPMEPGEQLPTSFDWRSHSPSVVTPVYNQQQCGSCWAFSVTEDIESQWALAGNALVSLSMQQIVDCDNNDDGCGGGDPPTAYEYVMSAGGLEPFRDYPYTGENGECSFESSEVAAHISDWTYVTQDYDETTMATYLYKNGPLSVCVDASTWQYYNGGVITNSCGDQLDHCVMITGFDVSSSGTPYWNVRNSWGTDWGYDGYLKVARNSNDVCGIADEVTNSVIR